MIRTCGLACGMSFERQRTAFWRAHKGVLYQGVTVDLDGATVNATYANMARLIDVPTVAFFEAMGATSSNSWSWAKVAYLQCKHRRQDSCEVQLKVAANETVQLELVAVPRFDPKESSFYIFGNCRSIKELSDMAEAAMFLKSAHAIPNLSQSELRKMLLQWKKISVHVIFFQLAVYHTMEEMLYSTIRYLQSKVRPKRTLCQASSTFNKPCNRA